jgi:hypothetical protein
VSFSKVEATKKAQAKAKTLKIPVYDNGQQIAGVLP